MVTLSGELLRRLPAEGAVRTQSPQAALLSHMLATKPSVQSSHLLLSSAKAVFVTRCHPRNSSPTRLTTVALKTMGLPLKTNGVASSPVVMSSLMWWPPGPQADVGVGYIRASVSSSLNQLHTSPEAHFPDSSSATNTAFIS